MAGKPCRDLPKGDRNPIWAPNNKLGSGEMWADVETDQDFLNFRIMAGLAGQMIRDANGKPLSIGVSGGWGVGKSSMVKLIGTDLQENNPDKLVFLTFNAWLYQGHDDAKAALMEEIGRALMERAKDDAGLWAQGKELVSRVNGFRLARYGAEAAASFFTGVPVTPLIKGAEAIYRHMTDGDISSDDIKEVKDFAKEHKDEAAGLIKPKKKPETPPEMIHGLRQHFQKLLCDLDVTLVVFVDDLDRCLPPTVIGTLEAMRLFLFMERTAFVIAADDKMIKEAVRIHFKEARLDDDLVVSYFDKLIQVPLRVPPLGVNEVRGYLILLFVENSDLDAEVKASVRSAVNARLAESWKGESVNAEFVTPLIKDCPVALKAEFALADRLAKQMATSRRIAGNPRLIKRFLNTLSIRRKLAAIQKIPVDDAVLAKVLLFERCAAPASFDLLVQSVNHTVNGKPENLRLAERNVRDGAELPGEGMDAWAADKAFVAEWLKLEPPLADVDLRGALHVGRESLPLVSADDRVSKEAQAALDEMISLRLKPSADLKERYGRLVPDERTFVMDKLLERAASENEWGAPDILWGLALAADVDPDQAKRLVVFLSNIASTALRPPVVIRIRDTAWGEEVLAEWRTRDDLAEPMAKVMTRKAKAGR
ncbi:P-loop NTPase fold protein [Methylobacterium organophilum]|uniref:KAP family NTPase n=1 Tax=Methylobacterium organophilum TaxID=410 RepID=UPI001F145021|nr:P-loop NTPase fold protein [Methylobacterium organophilum]UMY17108.1 P-loop NTPase fold protein [Methylobacterium organophilum]